MVYPESSFLVCMLGTIQIAGLISAWLARFSEGSRQQAPCQCLFFVFLALIGVSTMISVALETGWLTSGATLSVMVLAAIWDFRADTSSIRPERRSLSNSPYLA